MKKHVLICGLGILLGFLLNTGVLAAANSSIGRWTIWSKNPALQWEDAFVTGNGKIGSLIAGRPQEERITCVHEELFIRGWDRHKVTVPQTAQLMPYVRQLMEKGKSDEAVEDEDIYLDEFRDEIDGWVIDAIKAIGIDTAKAVLNAPREMLIEKTDLEEETVDEVLRILKSEFEEGEN